LARIDQLLSEGINSVISYYCSRKSGACQRGFAKYPGRVMVGIDAGTAMSRLRAGDSNFGNKAKELHSDADFGVRVLFIPISQKTACSRGLISKLVQEMSIV